MRVAVISLGLVAATLTACERIPDLTFASADGAAVTSDGATSADGGAVTSDGATSADGGAVTSDGATSNPTDASTLSDSSPPTATCPLVPPPPGVDQCCGSSPCIDKQQQGNCSQCSDCRQNCAPGDVCCYQSDGNLKCKKIGAPC